MHVENALSSVKLSRSIMAPLAVCMALPVAVFAPKGLMPIFVLFVVGATLWERRFKFPWRLTFLQMALAAFVGWATITAFWSPSPLGSLKTIASIAILLGLSIIAHVLMRRCDEAELARIRKAIILGGVLGYGLIAIEYFSQDSILRAYVGLFGRELSERDGLTALKPGLAVAALYFWPWAVAILKTCGKVVSGLSIASVLAIILAVDIATASVAILAGVVVAAASFGLRRKTASLLSLAAALFILSLPLATSQLPDPTRPGSRLESMSTSAIHRIAIWRTAGQLISEKFLAGHGFDSVRSLFGPETRQEFIMLPDDPVHRFSVWSEPIPLHTHNGALQIWVELGATGAILFALIVCGIVSRGARSLRRWEDYLAFYGLFGSAFLVANVSFGAWQNWWLSTLFLLSLLLRAVLDGETRTNGIPDASLEQSSEPEVSI